ncbi:MAG TPA: hypothetical protein DIC18_03485 [Clostridiales bacterium]|nr:hypothetical protein [Clostridiales bacterium]HCU56377.1 hypothetical protein [Clostridiales bacterium]
MLVKDEDRVAAERKKKQLLILYIVIACVYVAGALLLLFLSSDSYIPFMVGDIVLSIAFAWYSIFFFTVQFDYQVKWCRLMNKVTGALVESVYGVFVKEEARKTIEGVEMRILIFQVRDSERELHLLREDATFEKGKKYLLVTQASVIVEIGEQDEKKVS